MNSFVRFIAVGLLNTGVGYGLTMAMHNGAHWTPYAANMAGYIAGACISYLLNRSFTFRSGRPHMQAAPRFVLVVLGCFLLNLLVLRVALAVAGLSFPVAQAIGMVTYTATFYLLSRHAVFKF